MQHPTERYYGLDALRAWLLLAGILLHLAIPYTGLPAEGYFVPSQRSGFLLVAITVVHYFRMPVFFLLSGFFSASLWERRGPSEFLRIRAKRIGLVWVVSLILLYPVIALVSTYNHFATTSDGALAKTTAAIYSHEIDRSWLPSVALHLWFLEYLMLFNLVAAVLIPVIRNYLPAIDELAGTLLRSRLRTFYFALPAAGPLWFMPFSVVPYPASLIPWLGVSLLYGWYFTAGWFFFRRRDVLQVLPMRTRLEKWGVPVLFVVGIILIKARADAGAQRSAPVLDLELALCLAMFAWCIVFIALAVSQRARPVHWLPYLADSCYWIYLTHYPLALLLPALLRNWPVLPIVKVVLSTIAIFSILLFFYRHFVRYTFIGRALNGPRLRPVQGSAVGTMAQATGAGG